MTYPLHTSPYWYVPNKTCFAGALGWFCCRLLHWLYSSNTLQLLYTPVPSVKLSNCRSCWSRVHNTAVHEPVCSLKAHLLCRGEDGIQSQFNVPKWAILTWIHIQNQCDKSLYSTKCICDAWGTIQDGHGKQFAFIWMNIGNLFIK